MEATAIDRVFIGGSRIGVTTVKDSPKIQETLDIFRGSGYGILVGDAVGADKLVQDYLNQANYERVTVFHSTPQPRNLVNSNWSVCGIGVSSGLKGRELMQLKDQEMAKQADAGFMIWDDFHKTRFGNWSVSSGTLANILNLLIAEKPTVVYHVPTDTRMHFETIKEFENVFIFRRATGDDEEDSKNKKLMNTYKKLYSTVVRKPASSDGKINQERLQF